MLDTFPQAEGRQFETCLTLILGASYEFEPTFFGQAAGALVVHVMGCSEEVKISAVAVQAQDATNSGDALAVGLARYTLSLSVYVALTYIPVGGLC